MKINWKIALYILLALLPFGLAWGERANPTPPVPFTGGYNVGTAPSEIRPEDSPDCSNVINNINGELSKRFGSMRYIDQARSTNPYVSLYRVYGSTGTEIRKALLGTTRDLIVHSTSDIGSQWVTLSSGFAHNQVWEGVMYNNRLVLTGNKLVDPMLKYDVVVGTVANLQLTAGSQGFEIRAKHVLNSRNQLIAANVVDITQGATYYTSRFYWTDVLVDTFTSQRRIDVRANDGEEITGLGELNGRVHIFKPTSISELTYTILNLSTLGGDQTVSTIVQGFGLFAPRTLANIGDGYILGAKDGLRFWDGGRKSRLTVEQESRSISLDIKPMIDRLIRAGTYKDSIGYYYPKRQWYVWSFEDPERSPHGKPNSVMVYDLSIGKWFPFRNWNANSLASLDGATDNGDLIYGDSADGYVYYADVETSANDARKEISIHPMDNAAQWTRSSQETLSVIEGTGAIRITQPTELMFASAAYMAVIPAGEWYDKSKISKDDKFQFKVRTSSGGNIKSLRMDLEMNDVKNDFDTNFTSVTISSLSFTSVGNSSWTTIEINLSSFPILASWTALDSELLPFANALTFFGIRFVSTGVGGANLYIDDLRLVQATENPLNAYWFTKQFNFGSAKNKTFYKLFLSGEIPEDSVFSIDFFNDFGQFNRRVVEQGSFGKELFITGFKGSNNISRVNSVDFSLKIQTATISPDGFGAFAFRPITVDEDFIYAGDQLNNRIAKISKSTFSAFISTYGSMGQGTTNFNLIYQMAVDDKYLYVADLGNHRIKVHNKSNLQFIKQFGTLGQNTTSFHNPTGVAVDDTYVYVGNDGNFQIMKLDKSSGGYVSSIDLNLNTIGDITLAVDDQYLYDAYDWIDPLSLDNQQVILEKRFKSSLELISKTSIYPKGSIAISTYSIMGDIGITDDYIYVSFTDDINGNGSYYIQKRLKSDFSIVKEYKSNVRHFAVAANGLAWKPKKKIMLEEIGGRGVYVQVRYADKDLDNNIKFFNQAFSVIEDNQ